MAAGPRGRTRTNEITGLEVMADFDEFEAFLGEMADGELVPLESTHFSYPRKAWLLWRGGRLLVADIAHRSELRYPIASIYTSVLAGVDDYPPLYRWIARNGRWSRLVRIYLDDGEDGAIDLNVEYEFICDNLQWDELAEIVRIVTHEAESLGEELRPLFGGSSQWA